MIDETLLRQVPPNRLDVSFYIPDVTLGVGFKSSFFPHASRRLIKRGGCDAK